MIPPRNPGSWGGPVHRDRKHNNGDQGPRGKKDRELVFDGYRVSVWGDEKILDGRNGCTTVHVLNTTQQYLKNG